jgi:hypothetical protein
MMLYRRGLLQDEQPPARVRLHVLHRSERDEHGNWGRHSHCEPNPCVSASRRYFRAATSHRFSNWSRNRLRIFP